MPFKSKRNYKGKKLLETRMGEDPMAGEQAIISLQNEILKKELQLKLNSDIVTEIRQVQSPPTDGPITPKAVKSRCSLNSRIIFPRQVRYPSPRFTSLSGQEVTSVHPLQPASCPQCCPYRCLSLIDSAQLLQPTSLSKLHRFGLKKNIF